MMLKERKMAGEMEQTAIIVGAGVFTDKGLTREEGRSWDLLIAADGGLTSLQRIGLEPDVILGDFDSLGYVPGEEKEKKADLQERKEKEKSADRQDGKKKEKDANPQKKTVPEICRLPVEKDDTDMAAACRLAWDRGCRNIRIYGGSGSRPDHFLANLQLLAGYSALGGRITMITPACTVYAVTDGTLSFRAEEGTTFSVFSHSDRSDGVTIDGEVKYRIAGRTLCNTRALGVSNLMTGNEACISVTQGTLLVFLYHTPVLPD